MFIEQGNLKFAQLFSQYGFLISGQNYSAPCHNRLSIRISTILIFRQLTLVGNIYLCRQILQTELVREHENCLTPTTDFDVQKNEKCSALGDKTELLHSIQRQDNQQPLFAALGVVNAQLCKLKSKFFLRIFNHFLIIFCRYVRQRRVD